MFAYLFLLFWFLHLNGIPGTSFGEARICNLLIGVDEPYWEKHGKNISLIQDLALEHVRVLNSIFKAQVLNQSPFNDVEFRLGRLQVMFGSCDAFEKSLTNCTAQRDNFLRAFDRHDFRDFCLAYLFSHLDFEGGTAGYASVGTVCQDSHNSGFITSLNYGSDRSLEDSALTFTHEVGHNFGAKHDSDYSDPECIKKDYIMNEVYDDSQDFDKDGKSYRTKFSECSIASMREKLGELSRQDNLCFKSEWDVPETVETAICGNYIVEPGEDCDCGLEENDCSDFCCYPAHISVYDRYQNVSAIPCTRDFERVNCKYPPLLVYGVYLPLGFILTSFVGIFFLLRWDWKGKKRFFKHISDNQIYIVKTT